MEVEEVTMQPKEVEISNLNPEKPNVPAEKPAEEKPEGSQENPEGEKQPEEKEEEKENSVIRQMRKQLKSAQRQIAELKQAQQKPPEQPPQRENFETEEAYIDARVDYRTKQQQAAQPVQNPVQQKFEEARKAHPDFDDAIQDIDHVVFTPEAQNALSQAISTLQYGSEILYHIAKNPDLAEELAILPPAAFAAKLGDIHGDIRREKTKKPQISSAPKPITPVGGNPKPEKSYDDMSDEEFEITRRKERSAHKKRFV